MTEPFNHERLEAVITRALRLRADAEPRDGLEERVIATMRSQALAVAGQRRPWSWMAGALAAAALLLFTLAEIGYPPLARPPLDTSQQRDHKKIAQGASSIMPHGHVQKGPGAPSRIRQPYPAARSAGASAVCADGTWSYSKHRSGTCSSHGGVHWWTGNLGPAGPGGH